MFRARSLYTKHSRALWSRFSKATRGRSGDGSDRPIDDMIARSFDLDSERGVMGVREGMALQWTRHC